MVAAAGLMVATFLLVNGPADAGETAATVSPAPTAAAPTTAAPASEPDSMTADGTCISTACEAAFQQEFTTGAGNVTAETMSKYLAYAENMCNALGEGNQAVDLRDSAVRYNGFDALAFTITFASATETGSLCPAYHDQLVQLRD
jgi:hypothetical protein